MNYTEGRQGPEFPSSRIQMTITLSGISQTEKDKYHTISYGLGASQVAVGVKNPPANAGDIRDVGLIPVSGRSPGGGHGNPLQYHIAYMQNLKEKKKIQMNFFYKTERNKLRDLKNEFMVTKREGLGAERQIGSLGLTCTHYCV